LRESYIVPITERKFRSCVNGLCGCTLDFVAPAHEAERESLLFVKLLTEYLERALQLEQLASGEADTRFKDQLLTQARAYRKLAANRAAEYGLKPPSPADPSASI
jgi:hypothetical protein